MLVTGSVFGLLGMMMTVPMTASIAAVDRIWFRGAAAGSPPTPHGERTPPDGMATNEPVIGLAGERFE